MKNFSILISVLVILVSQNAIADSPCSDKGAKFTLAVHGGMGDDGPWVPQAIKQKRHEVVRKALLEGQRQLQSGMRAVDVVQNIGVLLEDSPYFNAGTGGIANEAGQVKLDASIMDGNGLRAGAVAEVGRVRNPLKAARAAMDHENKNRFYVGAGAENFATARGAEMVEPEHFREARQQVVQETKAAEDAEKEKTKKESGTIGVVALDRCGNLASATSTGGFDGKPTGRIGDSPVIGAGTYAENGYCAVSGTGFGEYFIRQGAAKEVCARMKFGGASLKDAAQKTIDGIVEIGGQGAFIAVDANGNVAFPNSKEAEWGLLRGYVKHTGEIRMGIHKDMTVPIDYSAVRLNRGKGSKAKKGN